MKPQWILNLLIGGVVWLALGWGGYTFPAPVPGERGTSVSTGTVYYVAPTGSDSNPGTQGNPWQTIQKAADTLTAGDTVYIRTGFYKEGVTPQNSGSAGNYIVYAAYPGDTVTIDGASVTLPEWNGLFNLVGQDYIRVAGLRVINAGPGPHNPGILVEDSANIIIEHNYVYNSSDSGIAVWSSDHVIIASNEIEGACYGGYNEGISVGRTDTFEVRYNHVHHSIKEGVCAKDGSSNGKVFGNHVHDTDAVGIYVDAQTEYTYNIDVFENVVHDIAANGFAVASEQGGSLENVKLYNNVAYHNKWVGFQVSSCCIADHPISNVQIINNTAYDNGWDSWGGGIALDNPQAEGVVIRNNICSQNLYFQIAVDPTVPAQNVTVDHNLIDGYRGTEGEIYGNNYVTGNPMFVSAAGGNFHLQQGSPAIDNGSATDAPPTDFDGHARPQGAGYDIGADEYIVFTDFVYLPVIFRDYVP